MTTSTTSEGLSTSGAPPAASLRWVASRGTAVAVALGLGANFLFVDHPLGLSVPVFALLCLLALFGLAAVERIRPAWRNLWLVAPLMYFSALVAVRAEPLVTFLNLGATLMLGGMLVHLFTQGNLASFGVLDYWVNGAVTGLEVGLLRPIYALEATWRETRRPGQTSAHLLPVLRGLALAVPVIALFTALLTSADAAFNQYVLDVFERLSLDDLSELVFRSIVTGMIAWFALGGLAYALRDASPIRSAWERLGLTPPGPSSAFLGFTETAIVLGSLSLLFAAFVAVQFRYFFGGQSNITVAGFTYAEYARRGFAELVLVALFTLGLVLTLQTISRRQTALAVWGFNGLSAALVALTGVILASAFQRLELYEEAYGFTRLRTYAHVFMVWLGLLLVAFLVSELINRPRLFVFGALLAGLGYTATLNTLNTDAFIARQNIARYQQTGLLDAAYLASLSDDAVPYLLPLLDGAAGDEREIIGGALHFRLQELDAQMPTAGWPGWHWASARAYARLSARRAEVEKYEPERYFPVER